MKRRPCSTCGAAWRTPDPIVGPAAMSPSGSVIRFATVEQAERYVQRNPDFTVVPPSG